MSNFVDYYEVLEISPNANSETIERMFRYLALRYHPDSKETGDRSHFDLILEAHEALRDSAKRAQYDIEYRRNSSFRSELAGEASDSGGVERDIDVQNKLLSLLYMKRRRNIREPGMGDIELEQILGCPSEHIEFHLWYLKEKKYIIKGEDGRYAITTDGVDKAGEELKNRNARKVLTDQS